MAQSQAAYFRLEHSVANKSSYDSSYMAAHANYCANQNKCSRVIGINMPTNRYAIQGAVNRYADGLTRKNANLFHKVLLSHPVELSDQHRYLATRRFMHRITGYGRSRAVAFFHDQGSHNPHCHIMLMDTDIETGKSVSQLSSAWSRRQKAGLEPNPTEWLRKCWEEECNDVMEEFGYGLHIDRRTNLERGLEAAGKHRGYENDNEPIPEMEPVEGAQEVIVEPFEVEAAPEDTGALETPPDAPSSEVEPIAVEEDFASDETEDASGDSDMPLTPAQKFALARTQVAELKALKAVRHEAARLKAAYEHAKEQAESARQRAEVASDEKADAALRTARAEQALKDTHIFGFRRGLNLKLGPLKIRTAGIDKAMQAEAEYQKAVYAEALRGASFREANDQANRETLKVWQLEQKITKAEIAVEKHERVFGVEQDFDGAETFFKETLEASLKGVSPNDVMEAYESGKLTLDETKEILHHMGHEDMVAWIESHEQTIH